MSPKSTKSDGGPAFGGEIDDILIDTKHPGREPVKFRRRVGGMSLRDYFAAKAMALGGEFFHNIDDHSDPPNDAEHVARLSYAIADAMLAERAK